MTEIAVKLTPTAVRAITLAMTSDEHPLLEQLTRAKVWGCQAEMTIRNADIVTLYEYVARLAEVGTLWREDLQQEHDRKSVQVALREAERRIARAAFGCNSEQAVYFMRRMIFIEKAAGPTPIIIAVLTELAAQGPARVAA